MPAHNSICRSGSPSSPKSTLPPRNPSSPRNRRPRRPCTISRFNQVPPTKCPLGLLGRPHYLDALSPVMLLPTIMTIICLDTCQAFSRPSRPPPVLHLHSAHSLLAHCSLTRSPHSSTLPHWPQAPPMPPQRSARPCGRTSSAQRSARPCGRSPPPQASGTGGARRATKYTRETFENRRWTSTRSSRRTTGLGSAQPVIDTRRAPTHPAAEGPVIG